ncbi:unnamed protein product [Clonostachys solani]|uniref:Uncharacterized protein n=1 Tax=Clonostachys solani TaxID=160281 RepID=A0A9N9Z828_9HYPO|nr:unnamed protein product [Clonostachys solani]
MKTDKIAPHGMEANMEDISAVRGLTVNSSENPNPCDGPRLAVTAHALGLSADVQVRATTNCAFASGQTTSRILACTVFVSSLQAVLFQCPMGDTRNDDEDLASGRAVSWFSVI